MGGVFSTGKGTKVYGLPTHLHREFPWLVWPPNTIVTHVVKCVWHRQLGTSWSALHLKRGRRTVPEGQEDAEAKE